ncbi:MAG: histidine kinase [Saprospiraceae bacterium]|nr:histidine kinase [Saprospiraceae bacterium]
MLNKKLKRFSFKPEVAIRNIIQDKNGVIWISTIKSLYSYSKGKLINHAEENQVYGSRITNLKVFKDFIVIATTTNGLLFKKGNLLKRISEEDGLTGSVIKSLYIDNDSTIWVGTNRGLSKIVFNNVKEFDYDITSFSTIDGLPAQEINDIKKHRDKIYLATENGIISFNSENLEKSNISPRIFMEFLIVNDTDTINGNDLVFKNYQNNIAFYYKAIAFKNNGKVTYSYKLEGQDQNPVKTNGLMARYPELPPGNYTFSVKASYDGIQFSKAVTVKFEIRKHWTQTILFKIGLVVLLISIFILITILLLKSQRKKHENKRKILLSEQKALRMQINPHFFFNSLGSIQRFIVNNNAEVAQSYLTEFSSLIRLVLENSKHNFVFMDNEIELIRLYLELEKKRFLQKIDFEVEIAEDVMAREIKIPPLLIQPIVENAIWHGIMPKNTEGKIKVSFSMYNEKESLLLCKISDNGIGMKKSAEINQRRGKHYVSTGLKNVEERIDLINKVFKTNMKMSFIDLYEGSESAGTEVHMTIYYI